MNDEKEIDKLAGRDGEMCDKYVGWKSRQTNKKTVARRERFLVETKILYARCPFPYVPAIIYAGSMLLSLHILELHMRHGELLRPPFDSISVL